MSAATAVLQGAWLCASNIKQHPNVNASLLGLAECSCNGQPGQQRVHYEDRLLSGSNVLDDDCRCAHLIRRELQAQESYTVAT